jgi:hypothetical protein
MMTRAFHLQAPVLFLLSLILSTLSPGKEQWKIAAGAPLLSRWANDVRPDHPLNDYPRPQLVRKDWLNLNGVWEFSDSSSGTPPTGARLGGMILVPFPVESALSGVMKHAEHLRYRRHFEVPTGWKGKHVLLHFGAVDWAARVFVNGVRVGDHEGGYDPFFFDITPALTPGRAQELVVDVDDPTDGGDQPRGKQVRAPGGIWYTPTSGIWQTVWLEPVPGVYIRDLHITPRLSTGSCEFIVTGSVDDSGTSVRVTALDGNRRVGSASGLPGHPFSVVITSPKLWSPSSPHLYDFTVELIRDNRVLDRIRTYAGMREISVGRDSAGHRRILLNGTALFQVGPLDQGFWPDGLYTAPTDEALRFDIAMTRKLGFNTTRKHVKVEPERWYYWADKLGLLVWQDMPSANNATESGRKQFERELERLVLTHRNHPSIVTWVVFNEGWGQYDTERLTARVRTLDPTRLVNNASGWTDKNVGDFMDIHHYPTPKAPTPESTRVSVLGEFGGLGLGVSGHRWQEKFWGYRGMTDPEELTGKYESFLRTVHGLKEEKGLSAAIYTQITDVEVECNGLLTYDRKIIKPSLKRIAAANRGDFSLAPPEPVVTVVVPTSETVGQEWRHTVVDPGEGWQFSAFGDSVWERGFGGFGTAGTPGAVVRTGWSSGRIWMRRHFSLGDVHRDRLALRMHHDEDADVYINGVLAVSAAGWSSEYETYALTKASVYSLRNAGNTLAVTCRQTEGGQYIDAGLVEIMPPGSSRTPGTGRVSVIPSVEPRRAGLYTNARAPLRPAGLMKLPVGTIVPAGWLRTMLELERSGMTGRLREISPWLRFETSAWGNSSGTGESGWEELPYWLKGFGDLAYVLHDETLRAEAMQWINAILSSQRQDGYFGPRALLTGLRGMPDMWPHMVILNVLQSYYENTGDGRVIPFMTGYFRWQNTLPGESFGAGYWPKFRFGDNIESIHWLYNRTGDAFLLDLAAKIHAGMARWDSGIINWHNVNLAQGFREPAVFGVQSGDPVHLRGAEKNYRTVMDTYGQFPGGGFAADENARPGYVDPRQGFETCGIVEFMHSFEMLTKIDGNPAWADRCEELAFNSLPAALTPDMTGLRYLSCANQVQLDTNSRSPVMQNGGPMFSYSPFRVYRCCQHNVSHGWPYFAEELWLATADSGACASLYAPCGVDVRVGRGTTVHLNVATEYPFDGTVTIAVAAPNATEFPLYLRVPAWCSGAALRVNGEPVDVHPVPSSYVCIRRRWSDGDRVTLDLPMTVRMKRWEKNMNAASVGYGPLWFSLRIREEWKRHGSNPAWPEWDVLPGSPWNYALELDAGDPAGSVDVVRTGEELRGSPFTAASSPLAIESRGKRVDGWQLDYRNVVGALQPGPVRSSAAAERITLIPMGAARLRISAFPVAGNGPDSREWIPLARPKPIPYAITASYCNQYEDIEAPADGLEPKNSYDETIPRMTWWAHRGTTEWVQYAFSSRRVSGSSVYWYDDTGDGECRIPAGWRLLYKKGDAWVPVQSSPFPATVKDGWNTVRFTPVETTALRLEVTLQEGFSGGILEWRME